VQICLISIWTLHEGLVVLEVTPGTNSRMKLAQDLRDGLLVDTFGHVAEEIESISNAYTLKVNR